MKLTLPVLDPLAACEVAIHITLPPSDAPRDGQPVLVSVGSAGQAPLFQEGKLADVADLIGDGWAAFGARVELQAAQTDADTETAVIATADVGDEASSTDDTVNNPPAPPRPPKPANLSLF
jgi:hypothetical protein